MGSATNDDLEMQPTSQDRIPATPTSEQPLTPTLRVVTAVAEAIGDDPANMAPLYRTIDTEALDRLLASDARLEVVFEYSGHAIEVASDGHVTVDGDTIGGEL